MKTRLSAWNWTLIGLFFCFCLRLRQSSFRLMVSDRVISRISVLLLIPLLWFSLDRITLRFWLRLWLQLLRETVKTSFKAGLYHTVLMAARIARNAGRLKLARSMLQNTCTCTCTHMHTHVGPSQGHTPTGDMTGEIWWYKGFPEVSDELKVN